MTDYGREEAKINPEFCVKSRVNKLYKPNDSLMDGSG
jgi:hypothetical protein